MDIQLPKDLSCVEKMLILEYSAKYQTSASVVMWYTDFFAFQPRRGRFKINANQYPLMRNNRVKNPCTAASGMI